MSCTQRLRFKGEEDMNEYKKEEYLDENILAGRAYLKGYQNASIHIWEACCRKFGYGGTPEANKAYKKIMQVLLFELD